MEVRKTVNYPRVDAALDRLTSSVVEETSYGLEAPELNTSNT